MSNVNRVILVVEDSEDDWFLFKWSCKKAGIKSPFQNVTDGQKAIDYLKGVGPFSDRKVYPLPSLLLLDLKLPSKNGFEVLKWIREQQWLRGLVVVILTSSKERKDIEEAYALGANAFLVKPAASDKMTDAIRALEYFWIQHNLFDSAEDS